MQTVLVELASGAVRWSMWRPAPARVGLAIADERPEATVLASDLSSEAVALARENADALGAAITVVESDLFDRLPAEFRGRLDAVVCNPPYVPQKARDSLPADVLAEPDLAVFGGIESTSGSSRRPRLARAGRARGGGDRETAAAWWRRPPREGIRGDRGAPGPHRAGPREVGAAAGAREPFVGMTSLTGPLGMRRPQSSVAS